MDPAYPYCDVDGAVFGTPGACISVSCTPGEVLKCVGANALTCTTGGDAYEQIACDLGCLDAPSPHCGYIEPRYLEAVCDEPAAQAEVTFADTATLDPNVDSNCTGGIVPQAGAAEICVVRHSAITVSAPAVLTVPGSFVPPGRAIAFVADGPLLIDGFLDVSAKGKVNGPGASLSSSGGQPFIDPNSPTTKRGGGGAGGHLAGAPGGTESIAGGAANGGAQMPDPALTTAFVGGSPAYKPDRNSDPNDTIGGGGGGGALMLISCRDAITITGTISAGGGGGPGGKSLFNNAVPGAGGGAGGYVVIQAKMINVSGQLFANGGWGGFGRPATNGTQGFDGRDALVSAVVNVSVPTPQNGEGAGGRGAVSGQLPTNGGTQTLSTSAPGGGGGSTGFLQTYTPPGTTPTLMPSSVAPSFQPNATIPVR
jgi:hypothetical protein